MYQSVFTCFTERSIVIAKPGRAPMLAISPQRPGLFCKGWIASGAQEVWARYPQTVAKFVGLPDDHMLFSGMALGYRDPDHPINGWRSARDPVEVWCDLKGFD
jgi:hypothetical protein